MNIQISDTTSITAYLASVIISFSCFSGLTTPISPIVVRIKSAFPVGIISSCHFLRSIFILTFFTAKTTISMFNKKSGSYIRLVANFTNKLNFPAYFSRFKLFCSEFTSALGRAKAIWAAGPVFKFFITPFACKNIFLRKINNTFITTLAGTILSIFLPFRYFKSNATIFAGFFNAFCFSESVMTFLITKLGITKSFSGFVEFFATELANKIMFFVSGHFNTSYCVEVLSSKGAHGSGLPCLSAGSYSAQAL